MTGLRLSTRIEALESASFDAGELYERACESKDLNVYSQYKRKFRQACMLLFSVSRDVEQLEAKAARYDAQEAVCSSCFKPFDPCRNTCPVCANRTVRKER